MALFIVFIQVLVHPPDSVYVNGGKSLGKRYNEKKCEDELQMKLHSGQGTRGTDLRKSSTVPSDASAAPERRRVWYEFKKVCR